MKYHAENAVSSFFHYMWNVWSIEECKVVFGDMYRHFWDKWNAQAENPSMVRRNDFTWNFRKTTGGYWRNVPS